MIVTYSSDLINCVHFLNSYDFFTDAQ